MMGTDIDQSALLAWEQQPGEQGKSYAAFVLYRDMGAKRSLANVAAKLGKTTANYEKLSRLHRWVERVRAWDSHKQKEKDEQEQEDRLNARKRRRAYLNAVETEFALSIQAIREERETAIKNGKPVRVDLDMIKDISSIVRGIMSASRQEYNDLPTTKHEIEYTMPPELRQLLQVRGLKASDVFEAMLQELAQESK